MAARWGNSKALWERECLAVGAGVASSVRGGGNPHQIYFRSGSGARLVDVDGDSYIDYVLGWGPMLLGHAHPDVTRAAHAQLDQGILFGGGSTVEIEAAERLLAALGWAERLLWTNTGTEAVQVALRLARAHTGRDVVIKLGGGYHGWHDTVLSGYKNYGRGGTPQPHTLGQPASSLADLRIGLYNDLDRCAELLAQEPGRVAAVLVDPTSSNTGSVEPAPGFLEGLRRLCDESGAVLIFDEVVSGLRLGLAGAVGRYGVTPDLATYGKAIGGGTPVAAVAGRGEIIDLVTRGVVHSGTFNGNPLGMAVLIATLDVLSRDGTYDQIETAGRGLVEGLRSAASAAGHVLSAHHLGATVMAAPGLERVTSPEEYASADWSHWNDRVVPALLERGIYLLPQGRMFLSTAHGPTEVDETVAAFASAFADMPAPEPRLVTA